MNVDPMCYGHKHNHSCQHTNVKYCNVCGVCYCELCGKEWSQLQQYYSYPWYYSSGTYKVHPEEQYIYTTDAHTHNQGEPK